MISTGVTLVSLIITIKQGGSVIKTFSTTSKVSNAVNAILQGIFPIGTWNTTLADLSDYIGNIITALEANSNTSDDEVVKITSYYKYSETYSATNFDNVSSNTTYRYFVDFTPSIQSEYLYSSDVIKAYNSNSVVNGTILGITNSIDMYNAINRIKYSLPDVNTSPIYTLTTSDSPLLINELSVGEYHWYKFTATERGMYKFYTQGTTDTYGEIFNEVVPGRSIDGRILYHDNINVSTNRNFSINYDLEVGQTIYIRVRSWDWQSEGSYVMKAQLELIF